MAKKESSNFPRIDTPYTVPQAAGENFKGRVSLTIPNQVLSVREILDKYTRGITDLPEADLFFLNDDEIPNFESMSKIDQLGYAAEMRHLIAKRKQVLADAEAAGEKVKQEDFPKLTPAQPVEQPDNFDENEQ